MEKVITCPVCFNSDNCFEEMQEEYSSYLCFHMGKLGIIFPEGEVDDYVWKYAKVVDIPEEERAVYDNYDQRLDVENAETFGKYEFIRACKAMGITENIKQNA